MNQEQSHKSLIIHVVETEELPENRLEVLYINDYLSND